MYKNLYEDTDSIKKYVDADTALAKLALNSKYGKGIQMRNEFIVLHTKGVPAIVRKLAIDYVSKDKENETAVVCINGCVHFVDEKYNEVVRRLFK